MPRWWKSRLKVFGISYVGARLSLIRATMFKRSRHLEAAILTAMISSQLCGYAQQLQEGVESHDRSGFEQQIIDDATPGNVAPPTNNLEKLGSERPITEGTYHRSEQIDRDALEAQQGMMDAAWAMFWVVIAQTILIFVGTVAILITLHLTRKATKAAQEATDAARDANKTTRDVAARQSRCYIEPTGAEYECGDKETATLLTDFATIKIKCINHGSSIGTDVVCKYEVECIDLDGEAKATLGWREFSPTHKTHHRNIAPSAEFEISLNLDAVKEVEGVPWDGRSLVVIRGAVYYRDVFGDEFRSGFVFLRLFPLSGYLDKRPIPFGMSPRSDGVPAFELVEATRTKGQEA